MNKPTEKQLLAYARHQKPNKVLVEEFMLKDPHCFYCLLEVKFYPEIRKYGLPKGRSYPKDMATIEHLYDRYDLERRYKVYPNNEDKVLSCYKCNQYEALKRQKLLSKRFLQRRGEMGQARKAKKDRTPRPIVFERANI